jgi:transcriptional regulator
MYAPKHFQERRVPILHRAIERAGLATLVTLGPAGLDATHVPMLLDRRRGRLGTLYGHIARANPQWRGGASFPALVLFLGPAAYITPSWYPTKNRTGRVVPTWNYVAVHAHGRARFFDDPERLHALVTELTRTREAPRLAPWAVSDAPDEYIRANLKAIVGFELPIARLEGKWKMSQNRTAAERAGVAKGLEQEGGWGSAEVARLVRRRKRR